MMAAVEERGVVIGEWAPATATHRDLHGVEEPHAQGTFDRVSPRIGGSLAERRAARFPGGKLCAPRISVARFRSADSPLGSPRLTIPAGLSPTALLDSPVILLNSQALPSPTTGSFASPSLDYDFPSELLAPTCMGLQNENVESLHDVKPHLDPDDISCLQCFNSKEHTLHRFHGHVLLKQEEPKRYAPDSPEVETNRAMLERCHADIQDCHSSINAGQTNQIDELQNTEDTDLEQVLDRDETETFLPTGMGKPSEDGYNWRKYGQKHVKGSEYPRSYYKCTHLNCHVKKKVERSHDGQITEIVYKGAHNHPKPQPAHRSTVGMSVSSSEFTSKVDTASLVKTEDRSLWSIQHDSKDNGIEEWQIDGSDKMSSTSALTDISDPLSPKSGKLLTVNDSTEPANISMTHASPNNEELSVHGSVQLKDEYAEEEPELKRRKNESCLDTDIASRNIREPRVVVQTESEVEILEDGYRWRKYGQKVVKGNPNPRSYYKCTNQGCSVRKHVERAANDLKSVITTYEGKHNHEVPAARTSGQNSSTSGTGQSASSVSVASTGSSNARKIDAQGLDLIPHFGGKLDVSNGGYLRPSSFPGDARSGLPQICEAKLPTFSHLPFRNFTFPSTHTDVPQVGSSGNLIPDCAFPMPISFHKPFNLPFSGFGHNGVKPTTPMIQSLFTQQPVDNAAKFLRPPKQELNDEDAGYPLISVENYLRCMNDYL